MWPSAPICVATLLLAGCGQSYAFLGTGTRPSSAGTRAGGGPAAAIMPLDAYSELLDEYLANDADERSKMRWKGAKAHGGYSPATFGLTEEGILAMDEKEGIALGADYEARFL